jgi:dipeptidyl aminopeptidase/acylaminoacyl peptidase
MTRRTATFGAWDSPLTPAQMVAQGRRYGYASLVDGGGAVWCEQRPDEGGRVVVMRRERDGAARDLIPPGFNARSRVHEYGGRPFALDGDAVWFTNFADQRLYRADAAGARAVSTGDGWRFGEPVIDARRGRIVAVGERHAPGGKHPENGLVAVDARTGEVAWLLRGHDFVASPTLSPDGRRLAFVAWEHPTMPWDAAALYVAGVRDDGGLDPPVHIAGAEGASVNGLRWRDDAALLFALEVDDRWQPHAWEGGAVRRVADVPGELGVPAWTLQAPTFALGSRDELVGVSQRDGESLLVSIDLRDGSVTALRDDLPHVGAVDARGDEVLLVLGYNTMGSALLLVDRARRVEAVIAGAPCEGRRPEALTFPTEGGAVAHGFLHLPDSEAFEAEPGALPPLIVTAHGGPTGAASPLPTPAIRFWTTRGFALLDVSYRGSTGFGRAYRDALRGRWGVADVADCVAGARWLVGCGRARGDGLFIRGGSAGGYTVLQALCDHDLFAGGACHYGISDPRTLIAETHKFESRYDAFLFGEGEALEAAMRERTPLDHPERIGVPVVFFQGLEDLAVPPSQTRRIHEALRARGIASEFYGYEGEQHGFRKAETIADVYSKELAFFQRLLRAPAVHAEESPGTTAALSATRAGP